MEGNKDEALKCLRIGKEALKAGDRTRALKFVSKARRLDPSLPVDDLLSLAADAGDPGKTTAPECAPAAAGSGAVRDEPQGPPTPRSSSASTVRNRGKASASSKAYNEEQITFVRQINKQKDYYQILGLERSCTVDDVRKAYRKLSLKVHPDKNSAPGAEEAFKAVSKAFQCLSNEETRKRYDLCGSDELSQPRAAARQHNSHGFNGFYEAEFDPDEIFRSFFSGMPPTATAFGPFQFRTGGMPTQNANGTNVHGNFNLRALIQLLPFLIFFLSQFFPSPSPTYMLSPQYPYEHKVETPKGVPYFVKSTKFEQEYPSNSAERTGLEQHVERDFFGILRQNCRAELQRQQWGYTDKVPHCDMLRKYEETFARTY